MYAVKAIISLCVILPLCFLKSLRELGYIATFGSLFIFMTGCSIIAYFFMHLGDGQLCVSKDSNTAISYGLRSLPNTSIDTTILLFFMYIPAGHGYFAAHNIIPSMMNELQTQSDKRKIMMAAIGISVVVSYLFYLLVGFLGAAMFNHDITDNILVSLSSCNWVWVSILQLLNTFVVIIVYPLLIYPIKVSITSWSGHDPKDRKGYLVMMAVSVAYVLLSMSISMGLSQILIVLGLFAAIAGCVIFLVVPLMLIMSYRKVMNECSNAHSANVCANVHSHSNANDKQADDTETISYAWTHPGLGLRTDVIVSAECVECTGQKSAGKLRLAIGYIFIAGSIAICGVSAYMNIM